MSAEQLNLRVNPKLVEKMQKAADRFGLRGKNAVGAEIIETYFEHWLKMNEDLLAVRESHLSKLDAMLEAKPRRTGTK